MKVKLITAVTEKGLESKTNGFLANPSIEVVDIQYAATVAGYSVLITYKQK